MKKTGMKFLALISAMLLMASMFVLPVFADGDNEVDASALESAEETSSALSTTQIIWIVVGGVVLVAAIVLGIVFRAKLAKAAHVYKNEFKKITWLSWTQTRKSTLVVLVLLVICAAVISLLDFGLSKGFVAFFDLFKAA